MFFSTTEWHQIGELRIIPSSHWLSHGKSLGCYCHKWYERMYWCISCTSTMSAESIYSYIICIILYNYIIYTIITSTKGRCLWHWVYHRVIGFFTGRNCRRKIRSDPGADQLASIPGDIIINCYIFLGFLKWGIPKIMAFNTKKKNRHISFMKVSFSYIYGIFMDLMGILQPSCGL